jgi:SWI/SNF-related matrix-associated actin-dependent regulator 1 of chromatin subfamily A
MSSSPRTTSPRARSTTRSSSRRNWRLRLLSLTRVTRFVSSSRLCGRILMNRSQLKNSESKKYKDLMQIKAQWRLLLTGTPLQNNLQELVVRTLPSLVSFLTHSLSAQSLLSFILPNQFRDANESLRAIFKVGPGSQANLLSVERINRAKKMMTPFVLRRKKAQVLKDLPKKIETVEWCEMTDLQQEVYIEAMNRSRAALSGVEEADIEQLGAEEDAVDEDAPKKKGKAQKSSTKNGKMSDGNSGSNVLMDLRKGQSHPPSASSSSLTIDCSE